VDFYRPTGTLTLCVITLDNGFTVTGESACADPANYRQDIGEKIARDMATAKIWPLLGFALKEAMAARAATTSKKVYPTLGDGFRRYRSHKVVEATIIHAAEFEHDGSGKVAIRNAQGHTELVVVPAGFSRTSGSVKRGDILVRYADGYLSHSPAGAFLDGYADA
jgi:hypothetical protein